MIYMTKIDVFEMMNKLRALKIANNYRKGEFKQVIVVNKSLGMSQGKLAAQVAHASVLSLLNAPEGLAAGWLDNSYPKNVISLDEFINNPDNQEALYQTFREMFRIFFRDNSKEFLKLFMQNLSKYNTKD